MKSYRRLTEDCKRTRHTLDRAANECRRRQDDACRQKNIARAAKIGIGCGGIAISVGVGIFTGGIGLLICLPIAVGTTAAAA